MQVFLILGALHLLSMGSSWAQGQVQDTKIKVISEKEIKLESINKGSDKIPSLRRSKSYQAPSYEVRDILRGSNPHNVLINTPRIAKSQKDRDEWEDKALKAFLKLGYGNFQTSFLEARMEHKWSEELSYGAYLEHRASGKGEVLGDYSGLSRNIVGGFLQYQMDYATLDARVEYGRRVNRFFGYPEENLMNFDRDTLKQRFNRLGISLGLRNTDPRAVFEYDLGIKVIGLQDNFEATESQLGLEGGINYALSDVSGIGANVEAYWMQQKDSSTQNRNFVRFEPHFRYQGEGLGFIIGLGLGYENEEVPNQNDFHLYPIVRVDYLLNESLQVYGDFRGQLQRQSLDAFTSQNPFLDQNINLLNTNQLWQAEIGAQGTLMGGLGFQIFGAYGQYENLPFFINNPMDSSRFIVAYESEKANILNIGARLSYQISEQFQTKLDLDFYEYSLDTQNEAWHRPTFTANIQGIYQPREDLEFRLDYSFLGGIQAQNFQSDRPSELESINDLSLQAEYLVFKNFSAILSANNLFNKAYSRYLYYPRQGLNFLIAIKYAF